MDSIGITSHDHGGLAILGARGNAYTIKATGETLDQAGLMNLLHKKYPHVNTDTNTVIA